MHPDKGWQRTADLLISGENPVNIRSIQNIDLKLVYDNIRGAIARDYLDKVDAFYHIDLDYPRYAYIQRLLHGQGPSLSDHTFDSHASLLNYEYFDGRDQDTAIVELKFFSYIRECVGDFYDLIFQIETDLHSDILWCLKAFYDDDWWKEGIDINIRNKCNVSLEEDTIKIEPVSRYSDLEGEWTNVDDAEVKFMYATFTDYKKIIDKQWGKLFKRAVPKEFDNNKKELLENLERTRRIRNVIAHPIKAEGYFWQNYRENGEIVSVKRNMKSYDDYKFLVKFRERINPFAWRSLDLLF